jgi:predicted nucleic acid-binding protein
MGFMYHPRRLDWPSLRDPTDGWIFDLAYAAAADYIVTFDRAVRDAAAALGFEAVLPEDLLEVLRRQYEA